MKRDGIRKVKSYLLKALVFSWVIACSWEGTLFAKKDFSPVTDEKKVRELAQAYDLFTPSPYAYHFQDIDIKHWAKQGLSEEDLRKQFQVRQTIRKVAQETGYKVASSRGELTAGDLSYWAERLLANDPPRQIAFEFKELLKTQKGGIETAAKRVQRSGVVEDEKEIESLARQFGLFEPNSYAWTFQEGDIIWYSYQEMTREELIEDFSAKAVVREVAQKAGYPVAVANGQINSGELSYWARFIQAGSISKEQLEKIFLAKSSQNQ
jgi:hypothetical protein